MGKPRQTQIGIDSIGNEVSMTFTDPEIYESPFLDVISKQRPTVKNEVKIVGTDRIEI